FSALTEDERVLIAGQAAWRRFGPGQTVVATGTVPDYLFVAVAGHVLIGAEAAATIFDAPAVLVGRPVRQDHRAGEGGFTALAVARPHVFTIARECPDFVVGLLKAAPGEPG